MKCIISYVNLFFNTLSLSYYIADPRPVAAIFIIADRGGAHNYKKDIGHK